MARVALLALLTIIGCGPAAPRAENVILISVDTLRADHMGMYGYARSTTPNLDRFFGRGSVFEEAVSPAPCTLPAIPQVLAGSWVVDPASPGLAAILAEHGLVAAAVASQHQFRPDDRESGAARELAASVGRGFAHFDLQDADAVDAHGFSTRTAADVTDRALAWLSARDPAQPFFLWVHYFDPHDPYEPPEAFRRFRSPGASGRDGDRRRDLMAAVDPGEPWQLAGSIFDAADVSRLVDLYDGEILYTDAEIGRLLSSLERSGIADRSVVAFFSDHGEWLGEGDRWDHCRTLRRPEIHVPLAVALNGKPLAGRPRVGEPVSLLDLAATVTSAVGVRTDPAALDGRELGRGEARRSGVFAAWRGRAALLDAGWKLLYDRGRVVGLFEGTRDTDEAQNRAGTQNPVEGQLVQRIEDFFAAHPALRSQNRETLERLRALGYAE